MSLTPTQLTEASELITKLRLWKNAYYIDNKPVVSDQVYDGGEMRLKQLIPDHPFFDEVGSTVDGFKPIDYVAAGGEKMLSLEKAYTEPEVTKFAGKDAWVPMVKLDGTSLRAIYSGGKIELAHTRGNGTVGDDVTNNFYFVKGSTPKKYKWDTFEVKGEVCMTFDDFDAVNIERERDGEEVFKNPRNAASGSLKQLDMFETAKRKLQFVAYAIKVEGHSFKSKTEMLDSLEEMGFVTARLKIKFNTIADVIDKVTKMREKIPIPIDGIVFALDAVSVREKKGYTGHHPKYEMAYKFASESGITKLLDYEWNVTRTRRIVPVGLIEDIELSGAVCSRVTLHNAKWVHDKHIAIGEEIVIERSGDVIPHFVKTVRATKDIPWSSKDNLPTKCPACRTTLVRVGNVDLGCPNEHCSGAAYEAIMHYVGKPVVNIKAVGDKLIAQLIKANLIEDPADLFTLTKSDLMTLDRMGDKKAEKTLEAINKARTQDVQTFLRSLGVELLGKDVSEKIADFVDLDTLTVTRDLTHIDGIAETTATAVTEGLDKSRPLADKLRQYVKITTGKAVALGNSLEGSAFCVSGSVEFDLDGENYSERSQIQNLIKSYGGKVSSSVSGRTSYLVAGPGSGSKSTKADDLGVTIIDGNKLAELIEN